MKNSYRVNLGVRSSQIADPPPAPVTDEDLQRARYEKDQAAAEAARLKRELEEAKRNLPSEEQRARWAELEAAQQAAEEERARKAGEFDSWRQQLNERHQRELDTIRQDRANEEARRAALETELKDTLVAREFADATDLFGPAGKTVLLPAVAQSYFGPHVHVEVLETGGRTERRVIVKDSHGATIVDPKTGKPMAFAAAMREVIDAHPQKAYLLRGSGKVGANSSGGAYDGDGGIDISRLKSGDFQDPKVRDAVRQKMNVAGGLQIGPGFDRLRQAQEKKSGR
jgi:hypothetical protein